MPVDANQRVVEPSQVPPVRDPRAPRPPERLSPGVVKGVEQRELGAATRGLGQPETLGERDRIVRHPVGDQQPPPQTRDDGQRRQGRQGLPGPRRQIGQQRRSEEHTSELQSQFHLVCRLLLEKKKKNKHLNFLIKKKKKKKKKK